MDKMQQLGYDMMEAAKTYPNDIIANAFSRVGEKIVRQGIPFVRSLDKLDQEVVIFYRKLAEKVA